MESPRRRAAERAALLALGLAGALGWTLLLSSSAGPGSGPVSTVEDWPKEFRYYSVLQQAVREARPPLYVTRPILSGRKLLAIPELNCSPQVVLLAWMPVARFVQADVLLNYAAGFVGLLLLRRRYRLGLGPFAFLAALFFFNGHVVAHMAVGHSMWAAHFLLPFYLLGLLEVVEGPRRRTPYLLALALFAILLRGGFHLFVWCVLLLLLVAAFTPARAARPVARALAWAAALGAVRLAPAAFLARQRDQPFLTGFPSPATLWHALVSVRAPDTPLQGGFFGQLAWWEFDTYVGPVGLAWLLVFGLALARRSWALEEGGERALYAPLAVMAALSLGDTYLLLNLSPIPLLNAERVSTRLLLLPVMVLGVLAAVRMQRIWESWVLARRETMARAALVGAAWAALAASLLAHGRAWRVARLQQVLPPRRGLMNVELAPLPPLAGADLAYVIVVAAAALVTAVALALAVRGAVTSGRSA